MDQPLIKTTRLSKTYQVGNQPLNVLQEIDLEIAKGEFLSIMGRSGSGKSTLIHLLGCLDSPTNGHYFFKGKELSHLTDKERSFIRATQIGLVFQSFNLIPRLTVFENVLMPFLYRNKHNQVHNKVLEVLELVGMGHRIDHLPSQLSGGESQRVAIARALVIDPDLILADEPTGNLDSENSRKILELLSGLNRQGCTVILVTHDPLIATTCQRTIYLKEGKIEK